MTVAQKRIEAGKQVATSSKSTTPERADEWAAAREAVTAKQHSPAPVAEEAHVVVDLRPDADRIPGPMPAVRESDYGLGRRWGAEWQRSAQGWVTGPDGRVLFRRPGALGVEQLTGLFGSIEDYLAG